MKTLITSLFFLIIATLIQSCESENQEQSYNQAEEEVSSLEQNNDYIIISDKQFEQNGMKLGKVTRQTFFDRIAVNGYTDVPPKNRASVGVYFGGKVKRINLIEGQEVKKGEILFTLESPEYIEMQRKFLNLKNQLDYLENDYKRQETLVKDSVVSQKKYLKAKSDYNIALSNYESIRKKLMLMHINPNNLSGKNLTSSIDVISPVSGNITTVNIVQGEFLSPSEIAVEIVNTEHIHIELYVYEQDIAKVSIGQKVEFKTQGNNETIKANVYLINKEIDKESKLVKVHCHLEDSKSRKKLIPGMYVGANILLNSKEVYSLPEKAVVSIGEYHYALVLLKKENNNYTFEKVKVEVGKTEGQFVEVLNKKVAEDASEFMVQGAYNLITE